MKPRVLVVFKFGLEVQATSDALIRVPDDQLALILHDLHRLCFLLYLLIFVVVARRSQAVSAISKFELTRHATGTVARLMANRLLQATSLA